MGRSTSSIEHVRPLAEAAGISTEATDLAIDMTRVAARSPSMTDRLPKAIAAGCLYTSALAVGSGPTGGARAGGNVRPTRATPGSPNQKPTTMKRNTQIGHRRTDHRSTEMTICQFASITPPSLRRYAREVAALYLDDGENGSSQVRERLATLPLR